MGLIYYENGFDDLIKDIAVVDFYATWCGPCKMFGPVFEEVSNESNINFVKVDVDKENDIARRYGVMTIPTVILFKNGEEVKRNIGYMGCLHYYLSCYPLPFLCGRFRPFSWVARCFPLVCWEPLG